MKRIVMMITVLAVLLVPTIGMATAIAGGPVKTALSCESPMVSPPVVGEAFQITGILTDGTSSTPVPDMPITVYMSTDEKKWMEVGSVYTNDSGQYAVTTSQNTAGNYYYKAVFNWDKAFKKVTSPTISVTVNPLVGSTYYTHITAFTLQNYGWFAAQLACYYSTDGGVTWHESEHLKGITALDSGFAELSDLGVPSGALVKIHAVVVGGKDRTGSEVFQYYNYNGYNGQCAEYEIDGFTWNPSLIYTDLWGYRI